MSDPTAVDPAETPPPGAAPAPPDPIIPPHLLPLLAKYPEIPTRELGETRHWVFGTRLKCERMLEALENYTDSTTVSSLPAWLTGAILRERVRRETVGEVRVLAVASLDAMDLLLDGLDRAREDRMHREELFARILSGPIAARLSAEAVFDVEQMLATIGLRR
jgi:hypothetical protein